MLQAGAEAHLRSHELAADSARTSQLASWRPPLGANLHRPSHSQPTRGPPTHVAPPPSFPPRGACSACYPFEVFIRKPFSSLRLSLQTYQGGLFLLDAALKAAQLSVAYVQPCGACGKPGAYLLYVQPRSNEPSRPPRLPSARPGAPVSAARLMYAATCTPLPAAQLVPCTPRLVPPCAARRGAGCRLRLEVFAALQRSALIETLSYSLMRDSLDALPALRVITAPVTEGKAGAHGAVAAGGVATGAAAGSGATVPPGREELEGLGATGEAQTAAGGESGAIGAVGAAAQGDGAVEPAVAEAPVQGKAEGGAEGGAAAATAAAEASGSAGEDPAAGAEAWLKLKPPCSAGEAGEGVLGEEGDEEEGKGAVYEDGGKGAVTEEGKQEGKAPAAEAPAADATAAANATPAPGTPVVAGGGAAGVPAGGAAARVPAEQRLSQRTSPAVLAMDLRCVLWPVLWLVLCPCCVLRARQSCAALGGCLAYAAPASPKLVQLTSHMPPCPPRALATTCTLPAATWRTRCCRCRPGRARAACGVATCASCSPWPPGPAGSTC
jgi:hypothetical protein